MLIEFKKQQQSAMVPNFSENVIAEIMQKYMRAMNVELATRCGCQLEVNISKTTLGSGKLDSMTIHATTERVMRL